MSTLEFQRFAEQAPNKLALAAPDGRHWSRRELLTQSSRISHGLVHMGLEKAERIALISPNSAQFIALALAANQLGCTLIPISPDASAEKVAHTLNSSGASAFFIHQQARDLAHAAVTKANYPQSATITFGSVDGFNEFHALIGIQRDNVPPVTSQKFANTNRLASIDILPEGGNVHYCGAQLCDASALHWVVDSLHYGHAVILAEHWDTQHFLRAIEQYQVTTSLLLSEHFRLLAELPAASRERYDVSSMRRLINGLPPLAADIRAQLSDWWSVSIYEYFPEHNAIEQQGMIIKAGSAAAPVPGLTKERALLYQDSTASGSEHKLKYH